LQVSPESAELPTHDGNYALHLACVSGDVSVIDHLIAVARMADRQRRQRSADTVSKDLCVSATVSVLDMRRRMPLHVAVINQRLDAVRRLLSVRASGDSAVHGGRALRRCRSIDRQPLIDIDAADADGYSPLHLAVIGDGIKAYTDIVTLLLQCGADVNRSPTTLCERSSVDPSISTLSLACQRRDLATAEVLLQYGACDADLTIMSSAVASDDTEVIGVLLSRQHAYIDTKYVVNRAALLLVQSQCVDGTGNTSQTGLSSFSSLPSIMIDWHALTLERLILSWLSKACLAYVAMSLASSVPPWLLHNDGHFATYLITRIDVSENHLISLPSMFFSLPSLRILIAASNKVGLFSV